MMQEATQNFHVFGRITKQRRTQLYVARTNFQGYIRSQILKKNESMCFAQGQFIVFPKKNINFLSSFWGILFFFFFNIFKELEKE
jgi:hypothetical protein